MKRMKERHATFRVHSISLQIGKEKSFNATHAGTALSLITLLIAPRYSSFRLGLAYTIRNEVFYTD